MKSKYHAIRVLVCQACGVWHEEGPLDWRGACINCRHTVALRFPSKLEARRHDVLRAEERAGRIARLELQPRIPIVINGIKVCTVVADFSYCRDGKTIYEDAKGKDLPLSRLKRKLAAVVHGVTIDVVR